MAPEKGAETERRAARVRAALMSDVETVAAIDARSRPEAWGVEAYRTVLANSSRRCWVAELDRDTGVIGFLVGTLIADQAEIDTICVDPSNRRRGVASVLLHQLHRIAESEGVASIFLDVRTSNVAAKTLYRSFGYLPVGTRRRYYGDGEDAACLRLDLADASAYST